MTNRIYNVLFLSTGNAARSIMAEAILNSGGAGRFRACSAGSRPADAVHPLALEQITSFGISVEGLRPKSWNEFASLEAPHMDFVITICDEAAGEVCPHWPGQPTTAHWAFQDPAAVKGADEEVRQAFAKVCREIKTRLDLFRSLPSEKLDGMALSGELDNMGDARQ